MRIFCVSGRDQGKPKCNSLDGILKQNELPKDNYPEGDRKELLRLVDESWAKQLRTFSINSRRIRLPRWIRVAIRVNKVLSSIG